MSQTHLTGGLLGIHALTSLHPGSGTALGSVDMPVQRERHTQWPTIGGSALKGILRDACREQLKSSHVDDSEDIEESKRKTKRDKANDDERLTVLFGPPSGTSGEFAGAMSVTDARILAFPVRSMKGVFAWVTCPSVLERLDRDAAIINGGPTPSIPMALANHAYVKDKSSLLVNKDQIVLEEFEFKALSDDSVPKWAEFIVRQLLSEGEVYKKLREGFASKLAILHDDDFGHYVRHATEISARIGLNYETKTVSQGALFYQEYLPPETLLYSVVVINQARSRKTPTVASELLKSFHVPEVLQIGGDETTGKGYCSIRLSTKGARS